VQNDVQPFDVQTFNSTMSSRIHLRLTFVLLWSVEVHTHSIWRVDFHNARFTQLAKWKLKIFTKKPNSQLKANLPKTEIRLLYDCILIKESLSRFGHNNHVSRIHDAIKNTL